MSFENVNTYQYDHLTLYDGFDERAPVLETLFGNVELNSTYYTTSQQYMYITFTTLKFSPVFSGMRGNVGFNATYTTSKFTETTSEVHSIGICLRAVCIKLQFAEIGDFP
jgi:hypothetical protein